MRLLASPALALLVARANAFSSTPGPSSTPGLPADLDTDGDGRVSYDEALLFGKRLNCPGIHDGPNYPIMLLWTLSERDANNDAFLDIAEIDESNIYVPEEDHARLRTCLHKERRVLREQDGADRLHRYAVTIPKLIPWPPIPPALPPETARAYATFDTMHRLLVTLAKCLRFGPGGSAASGGGERSSCPPGITPADFKAFFADVIVEFKSKASIATLHPDDARLAIANVEKCAQAANGKMYAENVEAAALDIVSGAAGVASFFLDAIPFAGLIVTAASIGAGIESAIIKAKAEKLKGSLVNYISGMQALAVKEFQLAPIQQWTAAHSRNAVFITRLLQSIADQYDDLVAFFSTLPIAVQTAMVQLANATVQPLPEFGVVSRSTAMINEKLKDAGPPSGESAVQQIAQQVVACFTIPLLIKSVSGSFSVVKAWTIGMTPIPMVEFGGRVMTTIASSGRRALAVFNPISEAVADSAVVSAAAEYSRSAAGAVSSAAGAIADKFAPLAELVTRPVAAVKSALTSALETGPGAKITSFCAKYIGKALKGLGALVSVGVTILGVIEVVQAADLYATFRTAIGGVATNVTQVLSSLITDAQEVQQLMVANDSRPTASSLTCAALLGPQGPGGLCWTALGGHCCTPNEFKPVGEAWVYAAVADCTPSALACDRLQVTTGICHDLTQADYDAKVEGSVCESDNECLSNNCGRYQAGDDDKKCCKAGCTSTGYWGYSYCYCMEPGTPCWSDAMCAPSGKAECEGNGGGFRKGTCKAGIIPDWQPCPTEEDYTCQSGKCGRYSETSAYYCCGAGVGSGWPDDWCAGLDAGHECKHNNQCTSDYCKDDNTCAQGNIAEWQPCPTEKDSTCASGKCGRYSETSAYYCCGNAGVASGWPDDWCAGLGDGHECKHDNQCTSDDCKDDNTCAQGNIADWQACPTEKDSTCVNDDICGRYSETSAYHCCGAGVASGWPDDWCAGLDAGHECKHNNQCTSDYCKDDNTCAQGNIAEWQPCPTEKDSTCASGKCGRYSETSAYYCCGNAGVASGWPDDWCAGLGDGHECKHDNQCTSDDCNGRCGHEDSNGCHPAGSLLELAGGEQVAIESAKVGDHVATPTGLMPIIGFLHAEEIDASYMRLSTASASMSLSALHQVFVNGSEIYPSDINIGDLLHTPHGLEPVTRIEAVKARGAYHIVVKGGAYYVDGILASDYIGDVSKASWPFVRLYVEARYLAGLPVIPIGRGYLRLSWPINLLDRAGAPPSVKHALAPFTIATCIIIELADVAAMHFLALVVTGTGIGAAAGLIGRAKRARG